MPFFKLVKNKYYLLKNITFFNQKIRNYKQKSYSQWLTNLNLFKHINAHNKGKHDNFELDDIEDTKLFSPAPADDKIEEQSSSVTGKAVADIVSEVPAKARAPRKNRGHLKIFCDRGYNNWSEIKL